MMEIPVSLKEMEIPLERGALQDMLKESVGGPDMEHIPYPVTEDMVWEALCKVEEVTGHGVKHQARSEVPGIE